MPALLSFALTAVLLVPAQQPHTLRDVMKDDGIQVMQALSNLDKLITSEASLNDPSWYVVAYYLDDGTSALNGPLFIDVYDRKAGTWRSAELTAESSPLIKDICLGSVLEIVSSEESFFLD